MIQIETYPNGECLIVHDFDESKLCSVIEKILVHKTKNEKIPFQSTVVIFPEKISKIFEFEFSKKNLYPRETWPIKNYVIVKF